MRKAAPLMLLRVSPVARRRGTITPFFLLILIVLMGTLAIAVDYGFLSQTRVEMQNATDAAALAAAAGFVDDTTLLNSVAVAQNLMAQSRTNAIQYGQLNRVAGQPLVLDPNLENFADGDILFGFIAPGSNVFVQAQNVNDPTNTFLTTIDAVRILGRRTQFRGNPVGTLVSGAFGLPSVDMKTASTVLLDHDVIGFRPNTSQPLPLAPIAILSDPSDQNQQSWEYNVVEGNGPPTDNGLLHGIVVQLTPGGSNNPNGVVLAIGATSGTQIAAQLQSGVTMTQLQGFGGQFVLDAANELEVQPAMLGPTDYAALTAALTTLQAGAVQRVFPLYSGTDAVTNEPILSGFVAARVANVVPMNGGQPLTITLQPTVIAVPAAVPGAARPGGAALLTPYIVKVRLVE
jgi:Flp pilus assembly protein TadG